MHTKQRRIACVSLIIFLVLTCTGLVLAQNPPAPNHEAASDWGIPTLIASGQDTWHSISDDGARVVTLEANAALSETAKPVRFFAKTGDEWTDPVVIANNGVDQTPIGGGMVVLPQYTHPVISGDGATIAYLGATGSDASQFAIYSSAWTDSVGWSTPTTLPAGVDNPHYWLALSANGNRLAYSNYPFLDTTRLYVLTRAGSQWGTPVEVSDPVYGGSFPSISASGRQLAYLSNTRLMFTEQTGAGWTAPQTLTPASWLAQSIQVENAQISPDGVSIFFWAVQLVPGDEPGTQIRAAQTLYVVRRLGTGWTAPTPIIPTPVLPVSSVDASAAINRQGTRAIYSRPITETDPYWGDTVVTGSYLELTEFVDGAWTTPITLTSISSTSPYACYHRFPRLSADGKRLIYQGCEGEDGLVYGLYEMVTSIAAPPLTFSGITGTLAPVSTTTFWAGPVVYAFAPEVFSDTVILSHTIPAPATVPPHANRLMVGDAFEATAIFSSTGQPAQPAPGRTYTITLAYGSEKGAAIEETLGLWWWDGVKWSQEGISSTVDITNQAVIAQVNHFSLFGVWGETKQLYLPLILR